eukprot:g63255.t1
MLDKPVAHAPIMEWKKLKNAFRGGRTVFFDAKVLTKHSCPHTLSHHSFLGDQCSNCFAEKVAALDRPPFKAQVQDILLSMDLGGEDVLSPAQVKFIFKRYGSYEYRPFSKASLSSSSSSLSSSSSSLSSSSSSLSSSSSSLSSSVSYAALGLSQSSDAVSLSQSSHSLCASDFTPDVSRSSFPRSKSATHLVVSSAVPSEATSTSAATSTASTTTATSTAATTTTCSDTTTSTISTTSTASNPSASNATQYTNYTSKALEMYEKSLQMIKATPYYNPKHKQTATETTTTTTTTTTTSTKTTTPTQKTRYTNKALEMYEKSLKMIKATPYYDPKHTKEAKPPAELPSKRLRQVWPAPAAEVATEGVQAKHEEKRDARMEKEANFAGLTQGHVRREEERTDGAFLTHIAAGRLLRDHYIAKLVCHKEGQEKQKRSWHWRARANMSSTHVHSTLPSPVSLEIFWSRYAHFGSDRLFPDDLTYTFSGQSPPYVFSEVLRLINDLSPALPPSSTPEEQRQSMEDSVVHLVSQCAVGDPQLNYQDEMGMGLLHYCVLHQLSRALDQLLDKKVDVDARDQGGLTALMLCAVTNFPQAYRRLLIAGADTRIKDRRGNSMRVYAPAVFLEGELMRVLEEFVVTRDLAHLILLYQDHDKLQQIRQIASDLIVLSTKTMTSYNRDQTASDLILLYQDHDKLQQIRQARSSTQSCVRLHVEETA